GGGEGLVEEVEVEVDVRLEQVAEVDLDQPGVEQGRRVEHQVGLERHRLAAEGLEALHRAVGGDGEVEHLEPSRQPAARGVRVEPAVQAVEIGALSPCAPSQGY